MYSSRYDPRDSHWSYERDGSKIHYFYDGRYTHTIREGTGRFIVGVLLVVLLGIFVAVAVLAVVFFSTWLSVFPEMTGTSQFLAPGVLAGVRAVRW
jgi:hypothetical protein